MEGSKKGHGGRREAGGKTSQMLKGVTPCGKKPAGQVLGGAEHSKIPLPLLEVAGARHHLEISPATSKRERRRR